VGDVIDVDSDSVAMMGVNSAIDGVEKEKQPRPLVSTLFAATQIHFLPYVEPCTLTLVDLLTHDYKGIRKSAVDSLLEIIRTFYDLSDHEP
jgi:importin-4